MKKLHVKQLDFPVDARLNNLPWSDRRSTLQLSDNGGFKTYFLPDYNIFYAERLGKQIVVWPNGTCAQVEDDFLQNLCADCVPVETEKPVSVPQQGGLEVFAQADDTMLVKRGRKPKL